MKIVNKFSAIFMVLLITNQWLSDPVQGSTLYLGNAQPIDCTVNVLRLNLRAGPSTQFTIVKQMRKGELFSALERSDDNAWVFGESSKTNGWTSARFVTCASNLAQLPITTQDFSSDDPSLPVSGSTFTSANVQPATNSGTVLLQPTGDALSGRVKFEWKTDVVLKKNQGFVVLFWREGQDPLKDGFALTEAKTTAAVDLDLDKMASLLPKFLQYENEYFWGVALVQIHPNRNLQFLKSSEKFVFVAPKAGSSAQLPAPPKPPK